MAGPIRNLPIGQILVENGFINEKQLQEALDKQKQSGGKMLGDVMLEMGLVSETQLAQALSIRLKVPFVDLASVQINKDAVMKIPEATAREKTVIAFDMHNNRLMVASNDPINFYIFEELKVQTGMEIIPQISTKTQIEEAIGRFYSQQTVNKVMNELDDEAAAAAQQNQVDTQSGERIDNAPIVRLVNTMVETAFRINASDIHIEPFKTRTRIRFRIDGELVEQEAMKVSIALHNSLITRIKILGGMNIAEKRIPLDGRFGMKIDGINLDVRVSTIPCVYGEKCVIRLLSTADEKTRKITDLGMTDYNYEMFKQIIRCPNGVMLVTGPTGSGKSTTLYATLGELGEIQTSFNELLDEVFLSEERHRTIAELSDNMLFEWDFHKERMYASKNMLAKFDIDTDSATLSNGKFIDSLMSQDDSEKYKRDMNGLLKNKSGYSAEYQLKTKSGAVIWVSLRAVCITDRLGEPLRVIGVMTDIDNEKKLELQLSERASYDFLSQLYNRNTFIRNLTSEIERRGTKRVAVSFIDVDDFKFINDRYGHTIGDEVIRFVADTIRTKVDDRGGFAGRFGGDEFVLCFTNQDDIANIENISMDIINELYEGYTTADGAMHIDVKASIGVAFCPEHTEDVNELLSFADTAMYFVKKNGKTNYHIYIPEDSATDEYIDPEGF